MEGIFEAQDGVVEAVAWYIGGTAETANYKAVSAGNTLHREGVKVVYDPIKITYGKLVELFWTQIDPTDDGGQFVDRGTSYLSGIFVNSQTQRLAAEKSKKNLKLLKNAILARKHYCILL